MPPRRTPVRTVGASRNSALARLKELDPSQAADPRRQAVMACEVAEMLDAADAEVATAAQVWLHTAGAGFAEGILSLLDHPIAHVRRTALSVLFSLKSVAADRMPKLLADARPRVRAAGVELWNATAPAGDDPAPLLERLIDPAPQVRAAASQALAARLRDLREPHAARVMAALQEAAAHPDPAVRAGAVATTTRLRPRHRQ